MKINLSEGKPNSSQRNNEFKMTIGKSVMNGSCMCNVTSYVMASLYDQGDIFPKGRFQQPEDNLCEFICTSPEVKDFYRKNYPAMYSDWQTGKKDAYWPNELHTVLAYGFNLWMKNIGKEFGKFHEGMPLREFFGNLLKGNAMPTSMQFGNLGHIICVVGFETSASEAQVRSYIAGDGNLPADTKIIFDDPYGYCTDFYAGIYKAESGNDRTILLRDFIARSKPLGVEKVWCHVLA